MIDWLEDQWDGLLDFRDGLLWHLLLGYGASLLWIFRGLVGLMGHAGAVLHGEELYEMQQDLDRWRSEFEEWKQS